MPVDVKICGLRDTEGLKAAVDAGARYVGFVFHSVSTRFVAPYEAGQLAVLVPSTVKRVGLFVDAGDAEIRSVLNDVPLNVLQLHGNETPGRVAMVRKLFGLPVMKALRIATAADLNPVSDFEAVSDRLLFDTRIGEEPTGSTGQCFDWNLLRGRRFAKPWMLAGGLKASNLAEAVRITGAKTVDVSSGVEVAAGLKDPAKIQEFITLAAGLG
jgi:phosphoribosylanthranilate isomerase